MSLQRRERAVWTSHFVAWGLKPSLAGLKARETEYMLTSLVTFALIESDRPAPRLQCVSENPFHLTNDAALHPKHEVRQLTFA